MGTGQLGKAGGFREEQKLVVWPEGKPQQQRCKSATKLIKSHCLSNQKHKEKESEQPGLSEGERRSSESRKTERYTPVSGYKLSKSLVDL